MGRRCQTCSHTSINIINRALLGGATLSGIARLHGLALLAASASVQMSRPADLAGSDRGALTPRRHRGGRCQPEKRWPAASHRSVLSSTGSSPTPRPTGQLSISVAALDGLRKTWADTARLAEHDRPADTNIQVNVNTGPTINIVVDRLLVVVDDPATRDKLATALLELDGISASARIAPPTIDAVDRSTRPAIDAGASPAPESVTCDGGEPPASDHSVLDRIMREAAA